MGYETQYSLAVVPAANPRAVTWEYNEQIISALRAENEYAEYALTPDGETNNACKWYDHRQDLQAFSRKHPEALFVLRGYGEETPDIWLMYVHNGSVYDQTAKIVFPSYSEALAAWGMTNVGYDADYQPKDEIHRPGRSFVHIERPRIAGPTIDG